MSTLQFGVEKKRDEVVRQFKDERTAERKLTFTHGYDMRRGPSHGSGQWNNTRDHINRTNSSLAWTTKTNGDL